MKVLGDAVLIREEVPDSEKKIGNLYVPSSVSHVLKYGTVISVGRGVISAGEIISPEVKEGDKVVYNDHTKIPMEIEGEEKGLVMIRENQILAIL